MPLYFGRTKSQFRSGYNWSESSIIVQKKKKIPGFLNPGLNDFPIFEKMFQGVLFRGAKRMRIPCREAPAMSVPSWWGGWGASLLNTPRRADASASDDLPPICGRISVQIGILPDLHSDGSLSKPPRPPIQNWPIQTPSRIRQQY